MTLYARSDLMSVAVPVASGGCGDNHSRPVVSGAPAKVWGLKCPPCESYLRGDRKQKKLVYETDPKTGQTLRQARVSDADAMWSSTPETVPLTPDEERSDYRFRETAMAQINAMNALGTAVSNGLQIPPEMMYLLRKQLPAEMLIPGAIVCADGHDNQPGAKFCAQCGVSMAAKAAISSVEEPSANPVDFGRLHPATLAKMCRKAGLPDKGSKDQLIARLAD